MRTRNHADRELAAELRAWVELLTEEKMKSGQSYEEARRAALIETFQPYNGPAGRPDTFSGDYIHQLALLQELTNTDKHRVLNSVLAVPSNMGMGFPKGVTQAMRDAGPEGHPGVLVPDVIWDHAGETIELEAEVGRFKLEGPGLNSDVKVYGQVQPSIAFPERGPIIPTLDRIGAFATLIVTEFEPLF